MASTICPNCGKNKKPWFNLCWECTEKENQKPKCEVCDIEVPDGHNLCKIHWMERQNERKEIKKVEYVKKKKEEEYSSKWEQGKIYNSPYGKLRSKSELLIAYFLWSNDISRVLYEKSLTINEKEYKPDFIIDDGKGTTIIYEHFGEKNQLQKNKMKEKIQVYTDFCNKHEGYEFIYTTENDIKDLSDILGKKFNEANCAILKPTWN